MELNTPQLQLTIMAVRDAIRYGMNELDRLSEEDLPDREEYLMRLGNLAGHLKHEYETRGRKGEKLTPYDFLVGNKTFRLL